MVVSQWFLKGRWWAKMSTACGVLLLTTTLVGNVCGKEVAKAKPATPAPPPPSVVVAEVTQKAVPIYTELVARTDAKDTVEIRARVQSFLEEQHFTEGSVVKKGDLLFTLDKREFAAQLQQAQAQLAKAQADLAYAKDNATVESATANLDIAIARLGKADTDVKRLKPLAERRAVPQQDYDDAAANQLMASAEVKSKRAAVNTSHASQKSGIATANAAVLSAKAAILQAEMNVSYCTIQAPLVGLIGERKVSPGNLVGKGEPTLLTTISSLDPIRVHFSVSEAQYLHFMELKKAGIDKRDISLQLILSDGSVFAHPGEVVFADRAVDEKTGTLAVISEFPNPDGTLRAGQFGRVKFAAEVASKAIVVPKRAVQEVQGAKSVLVVDSDNMVSLRTIKPGETDGEFLVVTDGVKPGERIIVEGIQKARPGSKVNPQAAASKESAEPKPTEKAGGK
jgi:membrane fusion protein (multidrug efflux system)